MSTASDLERQMLALINEERTSRGLQPVKLERRLNDSAEDHSEWMLQRDIFSHTGAGGSSATDRMEGAGFVFSGNWRATENIAWQSIRGEPGLADDVEDLHNSLMNSPGHRANILDPNVTVIGIGIEVGNFDGWDAIIVTQNFARTSSPVQLDTGGTDTGGDTTGPDVVVAGTVGTSADDWFALASGQAGVLEGKGGDDILIGHNGRDILVGGSGEDDLSGRDGNDTLRGGGGNDTVNGGGGNDVLKGQGNNDRLVGAAGDDKAYGGSGDDYAHGGAGRDILLGQNGNDRLVGADGNDRLTGGNGNDILTGGTGADDFVFGPGTDRVTDFAGRDQVNLRSSSEINGYADLMNNHIRQSGDDVIISDGLGNTMILEDTQLASLDNDSFIF